MKEQKKGVLKMKPFRQGILIGLLLSVLFSVAIALTLNDKRRRQLRYRLEKLRNALPGIEQLKQSAQETATRARETGSSLGKQVQESTGKVAQHAQEILNTVQQKGPSPDQKNE
jgi:septal ring factor EnvC (AmiA/AmiB activator)